MSIRIVTDSSADITSLSAIPLGVAPLKIITTKQEYVDNATLNVDGMVNDLQAYTGKSSTSCPNVNDWLDAFGDAEEIFCVTITAALSGCYNAAVLAKKTYEEKFPDRRVFVLNSLSTGPEMALMLEKLQSLILAGNDFDTICNEITAYRNKCGLMFVLSSIRNLANNGRVSPLLAKAIGLLGIRMVGIASEKGELQLVHKSRGESKALDTVVQHLKTYPPLLGKIKIAHCQNEGAAQQLKSLLHKAFDKIEIEIYKCGGLCSFYAEKGGLLIGFEHA